MLPSTPAYKPSVRLLLSCLPLILLLTAGIPRACAVEDLDRKLRDSADSIIKKLRAKNCKSVGVLTFGVRKPNDSTRYNVGQINQSLADRVEVALLLANDPKEPINILTKASSVAKDSLRTGVDHRSPQGRQELMALRYPRAWQERGMVAKFQPDVLLTGVAKISPYPKQTVVSIQAISRDAVGQEPTVLETITVDHDIRTMVETGGSYVATRGFWDKGKTHYAYHENEKTLTSYDEKGHHPLAKDASAYVRLLVYYDDVVIPYDLQGGTAHIPEPREHQKVCFAIERADPRDTRTYGVVLKVNGENTFFRQREEPIHCAKWLLTPQWHRTKITGYQMDDKSVQEFRILSDAESAATEVQYGKDVGQISLIVYAADREVGGEKPVEPILIGEDANRETENKAVGQAQVPTGNFPSVEAIQEDIRSRADSATASGSSRGLIGGGAGGVNLVNFVEFRPHAQPVMSATINYYKPRR